MIFNPASSAAESPKLIVHQLHNFQERFVDLAAVKTEKITASCTNVHSVSEITADSYFEGK